MAQYKVPQDVEADDKLLGPFSFRQFVYLLIAAGLIAVAVFLFQIFPLLAIIPLPPVLLLGALALPLKKDQPMETYLAAIVSYYLKPRTRIWTAGQRESTIRITAPKIVEESRTRDISGEEATHRLSFLADIVDTGGYAIKGVGTSPMRDDLVAEANATTDMFENHHFDSLASTIQQDESARHAEVVREMQAAINGVETFTPTNATISRGFTQDLGPSTNPAAMATPVAGPVGTTIQPSRPLSQEELFSSPTVVLPGSPVVEKPVEKSNKVETKPPKPSIMELANNSDFSVETIAKEAKRIKERDEGEVFISLH